MTNSITYDYTTFLLRSRRLRFVYDPVGRRPIDPGWAAGLCETERALLYPLFRPAEYRALLKRSFLAVLILAQKAKPVALLFVCEVKLFNALGDAEFTGKSPLSAVET